MSWIAWRRLWAGLLAGPRLAGCSAVSVVSRLPKFSLMPPEGSPPVRHMQVLWPMFRRGHLPPSRGPHAVGYCAEAAMSDRVPPAQVPSSLHDFRPAAERVEASATFR